MVAIMNLCLRPSAANHAIKLTGFVSFVPKPLKGTLLPQSRADLTGLPAAISPHLFQETWFTLAGPA
jgi:hypothetical protein